MSAAPYCSTYDDILTILRSFASSRVGATGSAAQDIIRYCVEAALRDIVSARDWHYLRKLYRIPLQPCQTAGTATYSAAGGAVPYLVTLTGATTATWMSDGQIRIGSYLTPCDIDQIISSTQLTLRPPRVPVADVTTPGPYTIGRAWYELPPEFVASWAPAERNAWFVGEYVPFEQWHLLEKYAGIGGTVRRWTIGRAPDRYGTMALFVDPWPSAISELDLVMKCRPRPLAISGQDPWNFSGTVSIDSGSSTVTGIGTTFRSTMVGSLIRFSDSSIKPTGTHGVNPYVVQQSIVAVDTTAQTLTVGAPSPVTLSGVKYLVTDPLDLDISLYDAFLRNCEKQVAHACGFKDADAIERQYHIALTQAKISDSSSRQHESAGNGRRLRVCLSDSYVRTQAG